jgi:hypothetical protein
VDSKNLDLPKKIQEKKMKLLKETFIDKTMKLNNKIELMLRRTRPRATTRMLKSVMMNQLRILPQ